jgi:sigma-B regulation protein RsbU (phosphoserine phosphatase)
MKQPGMAEENEDLRRSNERMRAELEQIQFELGEAAKLQMSQLPAVHEVHPGFCLDWLVLPSSYLAGDSLNYFMMQDRYLIFYQLDVAGHGVASALLSVTLNHLLSPQPGSPMVRFDPQLELKRIVPPVDVVSELNRRFLPQGDGYFTMIYGVLDTETREVRMCQAGHPGPIRFDTKGDTAIVGDGGFPVGLWPDMTYDETRFLLPAGERLLLYSDGLLGCLNGEGAVYGVDRLRRVIAQHAEATGKELLEAIRVDLEGWRGGRAIPDDISMLVVVSK